MSAATPAGPRQNWPTRVDSYIVAVDVEAPTEQDAVAAARKRVRPTERVNGVQAVQERRPGVWRISLSVVDLAA